MIEDMFQDHEFARAFYDDNNTPKRLIQMGAQCALRIAAKRFNDQSVILKDQITYQEVAEELLAMSKEV